MTHRAGLQPGHAGYWMKMNARLFQRIPYVVEVEFRTASSFLVAYSVNLSRGGMFLETDEDIDIGIGSLITMRFAIPSTGTVRVVGRVAWRRSKPGNSQGPPAGVGIQFQDLDRAMGEVIDRLVAEYQGVRALVVCGGEQEAAIVTRMVRAVLSTAAITSAFDVPTATRALDQEMDVGIIVADEPFALDVLRMAKQRESPVPIVALASSRRAGQHVSALGADEVVENPPSFQNFQTALVRALGRPMIIR